MLKLTHTPITPYFSFGSTHEIVGDHVEKQMLAYLFFTLLQPQMPTDGVRTGRGDHPLTKKHTIKCEVTSSTHITCFSIKGHRRALQNSDQKIEVKNHLVYFSFFWNTRGVFFDHLASFRQVER